MAGFSPVRASYLVDCASCDGHPLLYVRLAEVALVRRDPGVGIFNDDSEAGLTARERVVSILTAFRVGAALPPVEVVPLPERDTCRYRLVAGVHRLHCSLAAGFQLIPAIKGFDWASLDA